MLLEEDKDSPEDEELEFERDDEELEELFADVEDEDADSWDDEELEFSSVFVMKNALPGYLSARYVSIMDWERGQSALGLTISL